MPRPLENDVGDLVSYDLVIGGRARPEVIVKRIEVDCEVNKLPRAYVTCDDGDAAAATFELSASDDFAPGATIDIRLGYHSSNKRVFSGIILGQTLRVAPRGGCDLVLTCGDRAEALKLSRRSRAFLDAGDGDAIRKIASEAGLSAKVRGAEFQRPSQVQASASDWDFILARAEANGLLVLVENGELTVAPPPSGAGEIEVAFGGSIVAMDLTLNAGGQPESVLAESWDPKTQGVLQSRGAEPELPKLGDKTGAALGSVLGAKAAYGAQSRLAEATVKAWADSRLLRARLSLYRGWVRFAGHSGVKAGSVLALSGLGRRFSGAAYVSRVRHLLEGGDWQTEAFIGLDVDAPGDLPFAANQAPGAGLRPGAAGLQVATVLKVDSDPEGERRVLVRAPLTAGTDDGLWVRFASPYASSGAGFAFLPAVGDEIVLGFLDGDPDSAVAVGALHSSGRAAPVAPEATNAVKALATRSGLKLSFDDEKKIVWAETPGGRKLSLDDEAKTLTVEDAAGNKITLGDNGVAIDSPKDITIKAGGRLVLTGDAGVSVESSGGAFAAKGTSASVSGDASAKFEGGTSVTLSSGGEAKVQGAMVMIN